MRALISGFGPWLAVRVAVSADTTGHRPLEQTESLFGNEAYPGGIEVTIALRVQALDEEALRWPQRRLHRQ